jgi:hypothetical protein
MFPSLYPWYVPMIEEQLTAKNEHLTEPAQAWAIIVLPVPGGPYKRTDFHGDLIPLNNSGWNLGKTNVWLSICLASDRPITWSSVISDLLLWRLNYFGN